MCWYLLQSYKLLQLRTDWVWNGAEVSFSRAVIRDSWRIDTALTVIHEIRFPNI